MKHPPKKPYLAKYPSRRSTAHFLFLALTAPESRAEDP
uniref:Uncharacterized protein n=1 Tax=Cucumis melo TaxID=3656 RepID=A0A9I9E213_CUCME